MQADFRSFHDLRIARPARRASFRARRVGLHRADADPGAGDPRDPSGPRRPRRRTNRHGQDGGLHPAHSPAVCGATQPGAHPRRRPIRDADPDAHPRAGGPGRGEAFRPTARACPFRARSFFGGVKIGPTDLGTEPGRRYSRRDAGPTARPRLAAHRGPEPRGGLCLRRSRPHARHGLRPRRPQDHDAAPAAPPEPALLRDVLRRHQEAGRRAA